MSYRRLPVSHSRLPISSFDFTSELQIIRMAGPLLAVTASLCKSNPYLMQRIGVFLVFVVTTCLVPLSHFSQSTYADLAGVTSNAGSVATAPQDDEASQKGKVSGVVFAENEAPVEGATVYLVRYPDADYWSMPVDPMIRTTSPQGRFDYSDLRQGQYIIWAEGMGLTSLKKKLQGQRLVVGATDDEPITLQLEPGVNYDVTIVSAENGKGVENAQVSFGWTDIERTYTTDQNGLTQIRGLAQDAWYFVVRADGYATTFKKTAIQELGTNTQLQFQLSPGGSIRGEMIDETGAPIADGRVYISSSEMMMAPAYAEAETNMQGKFHVAGLPLNTELRLSTSQEDFLSSRTMVTVTDSNEPQPMEIVCQRRAFGGDLQLTVLDGDNRPVVGAELLNRGNSTSEIRSATTDENGNALLKKMFLSDKHQHIRSDEDDRPTCNVIVRADGLVPIQFEVAAEAKEQPIAKTVRMKTGSVLRGVLLKPDGNPAPYVRIYFNDADGVDFQFDRDLMWPRIKTDANGRFEQRGLTRATSYSVYSPKNYVPIRKRTVEVDGDGELKIQLERAAVIRARAIDAKTGQPIPSFNVKLERCDQADLLPDDINAGGIEVSLMNPGVNVHGTTKEFRLEGRIPGSVYKLIVSADGYQTKTVRRVSATVGNKPNLVDVKLTPAAK